MKEEKYCTKCGTELVTEELKKMPWYMKLFGAKEINPYTGKKNVTERTFCPHARWYNGPHTDIISCKRF